VATKDSAMWAMTLAASRRIAMRRHVSTRKLFLVLLIVVVLLGGGLATVAAVTGPSYGFAAVVIPHEATTELTGINGSGAYTGLACDLACRAPVFFVADKGKMTEFTIPFRGFLPTAAAGPSGIDDAGEIVGIYRDTHGVEHGFVRSPSGVMTELNVPGAADVRGDGTGIDGISATGVIVGNYYRRDGVERGFIDRHGTFMTYNEPNAGRAKGTGTQVNFYDTNEFGGLYFAGNGSAHGFYVTDGVAHTVDSPTLPKPTRGTGTELVGVSSDGTLYGTVSPPGRPAEGFADRHGTFTMIKGPGQMQTAGSSGTQLFNVSDTGVVVGDDCYDNAGDVKGFVLNVTGTTWAARLHHLVGEAV
jgi:hypothetical protein